MGEAGPPHLLLGQLTWVWGSACPEALGAHVPHMHTQQLSARALTQLGKATWFRQKAPCVSNMCGHCTLNPRKRNGCMWCLRCLLGAPCRLQPPQALLGEWPHNHGPRGAVH